MVVGTFIDINPRTVRCLMGYLGLQVGLQQFHGPPHSQERIYPKPNNKEYQVPYTPECTDISQKYKHILHKFTCLLPCVPYHCITIHQPLSTQYCISVLSSVCLVTTYKLSLDQKQIPHDIRHLYQTSLFLNCTLAVMTQDMFLSYPAAMYVNKACRDMMQTSHFLTIEQNTAYLLIFIFSTNLSF